MADEQAGEPSSGPSIAADRLKRIATQLQNGEKVERVTVREMLSWFGAQRRGWMICFMIDNSLVDAGLVTNPYFQHAYIAGSIEFQLEAVKEHVAVEAAGEVVPFPGSNEDHIRGVIQKGIFTDEQLRDCCEKNGEARIVDGVFGWLQKLKPIVNLVGAR